MKAATFAMALVLALGAIPANRVCAAPRPKSFVIIDPELAVNGAKADEHIAALMRRLETVLRWKEGTLQGKGFLSINDAAHYLKTQRPSFALLPAHEFVQLRKLHKLIVIGFAGVWEHKTPSYKGLALAKSNVPALPHQQPGLRLATDITDLQWLNVIFDGTLAPATHFKILQTKSEAEAVAAVRENKADLALVRSDHIDKYKADLQAEGGLLRTAFNSARMPPSGVVVFQQNSSPKETKVLLDALGQVCKGKGNIDVCADLGFLYLKAGPDEYHPHVAAKYDNYK